MHSEHNIQQSKNRNKRMTWKLEDIACKHEKTTIETQHPTFKIQQVKHRTQNITFKPKTSISQNQNIKIKTCKHQHAKLKTEHLTHKTQRLNKRHIKHIIRNSTTYNATTQHLNNQNNQK